MKCRAKKRLKPFVIIIYLPVKNKWAITVNGWRPPTPSGWDWKWLKTNHGKFQSTAWPFIGCVIFPTFSMPCHASGCRVCLPRLTEPPLRCSSFLAWSSIFAILSTYNVTVFYSPLPPNEMLPQTHASHLAHNAWVMGCFWAFLWEQWFTASRRHRLKFHQVHRFLNVT